MLVSKTLTLVSDTAAIRCKKINAESVNRSLSHCTFEVTSESCFLLSLVFQSFVFLFPHFSGAGLRKGGRSFPCTLKPGSLTALDRGLVL